MPVYLSGSGKSGGMRTDKRPLIKGHLNTSLNQGKTHQASIVCNTWALSKTWTPPYFVQWTLKSCPNCIHAILNVYCQMLNWRKGCGIQCLCMWSSCKIMPACLKPISCIMPGNEASVAELHWLWGAKRLLSAHLLLSCPGRHYQTSLPPAQDRDKHFVTDKFNLTSSSKNAGDGVLARNCKPSGALEFPGANQVVYQTNWEVCTPC